MSKVTIYDENIGRSVEVEAILVNEAGQFAFIEEHGCLVLVKKRDQGTLPIGAYEPCTAWPKSTVGTLLKHLSEFSMEELIEQGFITKELLAKEASEVEVKQTPADPEAVTDTGTVTDGTKSEQKPASKQK